MQASSLIGRKIDQTQGFLEDGTRVPLSIISMGGNVISQIKTADHEGYSALQLGFGSTKRANKPMSGHLKKSGLEIKPRFFREIRVEDTADAALGAKLLAAEVFEPGDMIDVTGTSKGKGYAGVVKRHGFHGGPKTHGQSDRHRAPGASGQGTTPGRVYRGKRMSGRMGDERVTVKNLLVLDIKDDTLFVKGLIPGSKGAIVTVKKVGKNKKFMPLWAAASVKDSGEPIDEVIENTEEIASLPSAPLASSRPGNDKKGVEAGGKMKTETVSDTVSDATETVATPEEEVETASDTTQTVEETVKTEGAEVSESSENSEESEGPKNSENLGSKSEAKEEDGGK